MKVCLLAPSMPTDDPSDAVGRHAALLAEGGHDVTLAITDERPSGTAQLNQVRVVAVEAALDGAIYDIALATSWDTTVRLFDVAAERHAFWVDGFGFERLGSWQAERIAAVVAYDLPVDFVCAAPWVRRVLAERRPDARALVARSGLDHERFERPDRAQPDGPLRVLVDDTWAPDATPGRDWTAQATQPVEVRDLEPGATARDRAQAYEWADVVLMTNPVDGVLGTPLEAARAGVVPIVLPAGGQEDLVEHLQTGIVATPEDARGAGRWLDRLAADPELLGALRAGAREKASSWPSWNDAADELEGALAQILESAPPDAARWPKRLMADAMAGVAVYRNDHYVLAGELRRLQADHAFQAAQKLRAKWQGSPKLAPVRRVARPLTRAAKKRLG